MALDYDKQEVIKLQVELFKTNPTPPDSSLWVVYETWVTNNTDYLAQPESNIVMASYSAYLNCLESKGKILSSTSIGDLSVTYAGNGNNGFVGCINNIYTILDTLNLDVDFGETLAYNFVAIGGKCK